MNKEHCFQQYVMLPPFAALAAVDHRGTIEGVLEETGVFTHFFDLCSHALRSLAILKWFANI